MQHREHDDGDEQPIDPGHGSILAHHEISRQSTFGLPPADSGSHEPTGCPRSYSRIVARSFFCSAPVMRPTAATTSEADRVRSEDRKDNAYAKFRWPGGTGGPLYTSKSSAASSRSPPASSMTRSTSAADTPSGTTTARSRRTDGYLGSGVNCGWNTACLSTSSRSSSATYTPGGSSAAAATSGCSSPNVPRGWPVIETCAARPGCSHGTVAGGNRGRPIRSSDRSDSTTPFRWKKVAGDTCSGVFHAPRSRRPVIRIATPPRSRTAAPEGWEVRPTSN